jgi:serine/threonine protein kinase
MQVGASVSHYKILENLGEGGMGVVYKAEDTRLKCTVTWEILPPELTVNPDATKHTLIKEGECPAQTSI